MKRSDKLKKAFLFSLFALALAGWHREGNPEINQETAVAQKDQIPGARFLPECDDWFGSWCIYPVQKIKADIKSGKNVNEIKEVPLIADWVTEPEKISVSPILATALRGDTEGVKALKKAGANLDVTLNPGNEDQNLFPLYLAIAFNEPGAVKALIEAGADVRGCPASREWLYENKSPLAFAISNLNDRSCRTKATRKRALETVVFLLKNGGADIKSWETQKESESELYKENLKAFSQLISEMDDEWSFQMGGEAALSLFVKKFEPFDFEDEEAARMFKHALWGKYPLAVKLLLEHGKNIKALNRLNDSARDISKAAARYPELAKLFTEKGISFETQQPKSNDDREEADEREDAKLDLSDPPDEETLFYALSALAEAQKEKLNLKEGPQSAQSARKAARLDQKTLLDQIKVIRTKVPKLSDRGSAILLSEAVQKPQHAEILELLLQNGVNANAMHEQSESIPMLIAALVHNSKAMDLLLAHGLDLKAQAPLLLMGNMAYGDEESLELLIKRGIDVNTRISMSRFSNATPLMLTARMSPQPGLKALVPGTSGAKVLKMLLMLLEAGADLHAKDDEGHDALYYAKQNALPQVAKIIQKALELDAKKAR